MTNYTNGNKNITSIQEFNRQQIPIISSKDKKFFECGSSLSTLSTKINGRICANNYIWLALGPNLKKT